MSSKLTATAHSPHTRHYDIDGDRAAGAAYCTAVNLFRANDREPNWKWLLRYHDEPEKVDGA